MVIKNIPLLNSSICRQICDMSADIENTVIIFMKKSEIFAMQVDESTYISGKAQSMISQRFSKFFLFYQWANAFWRLDFTKHC